MASLHAVRLVKERVVLDRLESLVGRAPDDSSERVLATIVTAATSQRAEIEDVLIGWRRALTRGAGLGRPRARDAIGPLPYRDVVESLIRSLEQAAATYEAAGADCPVPDLAVRLQRLADEDREHVAVLRELLDRPVER